MTNHPARDRVEIYPLDSNYRRYHYNTLLSHLPPSWTPLALCNLGILAKTPSGNLAAFQGDRMVTVNPRKAKVALANAGIDA